MLKRVIRGAALIVVAGVATLFPAHGRAYDHARAERWHARDERWDDDEAPAGGRHRRWSSREERWNAREDHGHSSEERWHSRADRWSCAVLPYLWLPSVSATLRYGPPPSSGNSANVEVDSGSLLEALNFVFMGGLQVRHGPWLLAADLVYVDLANNASRVRSVDFAQAGEAVTNVDTTQLNLDTQTAFTGTMLTLVAGCALSADRTGHHDLLAGVRTASIDAKTTASLSADVTVAGNPSTFSRTATADKSETFTTGIVGAKGRFNLAGPWFVPYYVDLGAGKSISTYQLSAGLGWDFPFGDVRLTYRVLSYDKSDGQLVEKLTLSGPALGAVVFF